MGSHTYGNFLLPFILPVKSVVTVGVSGVHRRPHSSFGNFQYNETVSFSRDAYFLKPDSLHLSLLLLLLLSRFSRVRLCVTP